MPTVPSAGSLAISPARRLTPTSPTGPAGSRLPADGRREDAVRSWRQLADGLDVAPDHRAQVGGQLRRVELDRGDVGDTPRNPTRSVFGLPSAPTITLSGAVEGLSCVDQRCRAESQPSCPARSTVSCTGVPVFVRIMVRISSHDCTAAAVEGR